MQEGSQRRIRLSTDECPNEKRLAMWRELYARERALANASPADKPRRAEITFSRLPDVNIAAGTHSPAHERVRHELFRDARDIVAVNILRSGEASVTHFGQQSLEQELIGGGASVLNGDEASVGTLTTDDCCITLALSRSAVAERAPDFAAALGKPIPADDPALRLLVKYLKAVLGAEELANPNVARSVSAHILDLVALTLGGRGENAELALGGARAARLKALKADVMSMLGNSELSSELIAGRHGISSRYVRKLFEQEGASFTTFVLSERLTRVHRMLPEQRYAHLTIAQIAHACGFNDISYFNRAFRRHFSATPTGVREAVRNP